MTTELLARFAPLIRSMPRDELDREIEKPSRFLLETAGVGQKRIDIAYAPFDFINHDARVVIVGLTPGRQQMRNALHEAWRLLASGGSIDAVAQAAKVFASFSGPMRINLVEMLDYVGIARVLGIETTASLWDGSANIVHFTSALRYPVFLDGGNYSGAPDILRTPVLRSQLRQWFATEVASLRDAIFVPLGSKVATAVDCIAQECGVSRDRVLSGLPHPSGASAERVKYFLGRKERSDLSNKTNPDKLDAAREKLMRQIERL